MRFISSIYVSVALLWAAQAAPVPDPAANASPAAATDGPIIRVAEIASTDSDAGFDVFQPIDVALDEADIEAREKSNDTSAYCVIA
ncbi:hypothetical protein FB451DRAFT_1393662 [Mycena latifolia]|nr:hypothetical protein FB451DRAFT_1393662 [Mycena latifolia]